MHARSARLLRLPLVALLLLSTAMASAAPSLSDLRWMTEEYAPINFSNQDGVATGISVDMLQAMMAHLGQPFDPAGVQVLPWARGYRIVQEQPNSCLFATTVTESRLELFRFISPLVENRVSVIAPRAAGRVIDSPEALTQLSIGVVREDIGELLLHEAGIDGNLVRVDSARALVRMLAAGRFDAIAYSFLVTSWAMLENDIDPGDFESIHVLQEGVMGFSCHPETAPELLQSLQQALDTVNENGTAATIRGRYSR